MKIKDVQLESVKVKGKFVLISFFIAFLFGIILYNFLGIIRVNVLSTMSMWFAVIGFLWLWGLLSYLIMVQQERYAKIYRFNITRTAHKVLAVFEGFFSAAFIGGIYLFAIDKLISHLLGLTGTVSSLKLTSSTIGFFIIWSLVSIILIRHKSHITFNQNNILATISVVRDIPATYMGGRKYERQIVRLDWGPMLISLSNYLREKGSNRNIAIAGMSRSGKTYLVYWLMEELKEFKTETGRIIPLHRIIFQAKKSDKFKELGIPTLFIKNYVPNVFQNPDAFVMAWNVAFKLNEVGITAGSIGPLLLDIVRSIQDNPSWENFYNKINKMLKSEKDNSTRSALMYIQLTSHSIAIEDYTGKFRAMANIELPEDIVIDFEDVNKSAFTFYGEYLLRQLDTEIEDGKREGTSIVVDEAHLFNVEDSILPKISAEISSRGSLIVATQQISSISGQIKGNCATQFCFKETDKDDVDEISVLGDSYNYIVPILNPYEFVDLAQGDEDHNIYIMRILNFQFDWKPIQERKPIEIKAKEEDQIDDVEDLNNKSVNPKEKTLEVAPTEIKNYKKEILNILTEAANIQDIAKRFAEIYGGEANKYRLRIRNKLQNMLANGEIGMALIDYVKFVNNKTFVTKNTRVYFKKDSSSKELHNYILRGIADVLYHKGIITEIPPKNVSNIEENKTVYEVELGLNNDISNIQERIDNYGKSGKKTIIIAINEEVKNKYASEYHNAMVMTLPELWQV